MENKCCSKCLKCPDYDKHDFCHNKECKCHTSPKEEDKIARVCFCPSCENSFSSLTAKVGTQSWCPHCDNNAVCSPWKLDVHSPKEEVNFLRIGETIACGHCDERFIEGLKQAEEIGYFKTHKCDCICHYPKEEPDFEIGYCNKCIQSTNHLNGICQKCPKEEINYYVVGETKECGACNSKYRDCRDITAEYPNITCDCICHSPKEEITANTKEISSGLVNDWESGYRKEFNKIWEPLFDVSSWKEVGNKVKDFNIKYISSTENRVEKEFNEKLEKVIRTMERNNDIIFKQNIEDIIKLGEKLKQSIDNAVPHSQHKFAILGRNNAIEDYQNLIKSKYE